MHVPSPWTPGQDRALNITCKLTSILGMAGSISIIVLYARTPKSQRTMRHTILASLSGCLLLPTIGQFMGTWTFGSKQLCAFQGFLSQFTIGNVLWIVHLMTHMVLRVQFRISEYKLRYFPIFATVISFGFPAAIGSYYAINGMIAPSGQWCILAARYTRQRQFLLSLVWACIIYLAFISGVFIFGLYHHSQHFRRRNMPVESPLDKWMIAQVFSFTLILSINWVPPTANRIYNMKYPTKPSFALAYANVLIGPLEGFGNFLVYVFPTLYRKFMATGQINRFVLNLNNVLPARFNPADYERSSTQNHAALLQMTMAIETLSEQPRETYSGMDLGMPKTGNARSTVIGQKSHEDSMSKHRQEAHVQLQRMGDVSENSVENTGNLNDSYEAPDILNEISTNPNLIGVNTNADADKTADVFGNASMGPH